MCWSSMLHIANNAFGRTGSNLGMDEFYVILVHGSKMIYLAFKSLTYEQIFNQMTCRVTAVSTVKKKLNAKLAVPSLDIRISLANYNSALDEGHLCSKTLWVSRIADSRPNYSQNAH